jgi:hypothetical protein
MISSGFPKIIILLFCIGFLLFVAMHAVNMPYQDDVNLLQTTLLQDDPKALILNLFRADSDHIQVFPKIAAILQDKIFGQVNYRWLAIWMNCLVILALYFLVKIPQKIKNWYYFIPVFLMLLHPQLYENSFWVLPGLQHSFTFLFVVLALFQLNLQSKHNLISIFWAICATFCSGNGLLAFFAIIFILILYKKPVGYAILGFVASLSVYLLSYKPSPAVRNSVDFNSIFKFQGLFWASPFEVFNRAHISQPIGLSVLGFIIFIGLYFTWKIFTQNQRILLPIAKLIGVLIFCGGTALLISLSREYDIIFSRFQYYAFIGFVCIYLLVLEVLESRFQKYFGMFTGGLFCVITVFSYFSNYIKVENSKAKYLADTFNWSQNKTMMMVDEPFLDLVIDTYHKAEKKNLRIENEVIEYAELAKLIQQKSKQLSSNINLNLSPDPYPRRYFANDHYIISSENFAEKQRLNETFFIVFASDKHKYFIAPQFNANFKGTFLKTRKYYQKGFYADLPALNFADGDYQIYILRKSKEVDYQLFATRQKLQIKAKKPSLLSNEILPGTGI